MCFNESFTIRLGKCIKEVNGVNFNSMFGVKKLICSLNKSCESRVQVTEDQKIRSSASIWKSLVDSNRFI